MKQLIEQVSQEFQRLYGQQFILIYSPGRVNLIGEHTDYNEGFVLPAAIDKGIVMAMAANDTGMGRFNALDLEESYHTELSGGLEKSSRGWVNFILGIVDQLQSRGYQVGGFDCVFRGNLPIGAGLSSSAALGNGVLYGLTRLFEWEMDPIAMAHISQQSENEFVGVQCGIMDQFISLNGKEGHAVKLDCRSLEYEYYPFRQEDVRIVLCDTGVRRELASSEYNIRRSQCSEGVRQLQRLDSSIQSLRDVSIEFLEKHKNNLDPVIYSRCRFVVEENQRVLQACQKLQQEDLDAFGHCMYASHEGLKDLYEVSCPELDILVDSARQMEGVIGSRMMGGGFGGCTINLVNEHALVSFTDKVSAAFRKEFGRSPEFYKVNVFGGTQRITADF